MTEKVPEAAVHPAAKVIARALRHRAEQIERGTMGERQTQTPNQIAEEALRDALPHLLPGVPKDTPQLDHAAEALRWLTSPKDPQPGQRELEIQIAQAHASLAIAEGQERVAEELKAIKESLAFGMRDEIHQVLSEIVVAVKEGVGNA